MKIKFAWYDIWIGFYFDEKNNILYICPLPMLLIEIPFMKEKKLGKKHGR